jgi:pimeloyl-ACP methyl ester carboxylesterase
MGVGWQTIQAGPDTAEHGVLLLPGGSCAARSFHEVMAQPALAEVRLVAATLPGHAGTAAPEDFSVENYARLAAEVAERNRCDVVAGFSMGATVALEMVASREFKGPVVLLGISLSLQDEAAFFRAAIRMGTVLGSLPAAALKRMAALLTRQAHVSDEQRARMRADFRSNDARVLQHGLSAYVDYLGRHESPARRLCDADVPAWVVHADKGDGGLTAEERRTLEACPRVRVVTIPGNWFFLPEEQPARLAEVIAEAVTQAA